LSLKVVFTFIAASLLTIFAAGSVLMAFASAMLSGLNSQASSIAGGWAIAFFIGAILVAVIATASRTQGHGL